MPLRTDLIEPLALQTHDLPWEPSPVARQGRAMGDVLRSDVQHREGGWRDSVARSRAIRPD